MALQSLFIRGWKQLSAYITTLRKVHNSKFLIVQFLMRKAQNSTFNIQNSTFLELYPTSQFVPNMSSHL